MDAINFTDEPLIVLAVAFCSWPIYRSLAKSFFGKRYQHLREIIRLAFLSDWQEIKQAKYWESKDAYHYILLYIFMCIAWVLSISEFICRMKLTSA